MDLILSVKLNLLIWRICGLWPPVHYKTWRYFLYNIYFLVLFIPFMVIYTMGMFWHLFLNFSDLNIITESAFISLTFLAMFPKIYKIVKNRDGIKIILEILQNISPDNIQPEKLKLMEDSVKLARTTTSLFIYTSFVSLIMIYITPLLSAEPRRLPFLASYGFDFTPYPIYQGMYIYQVVGITYACFLNIAMDTFISSLMIVAGGQLDVLASSLKELGASHFLEDHQKLKDCVEHYGVIIKFVQQIEDLFGFSVFFQFLMSGIIVCLTAFQMSVISLVSAQFAMLLFYQCLLQFQIFLPCWFGNEMMVKSSNLCDAAFGSSWPDADQKLRKMISIFMESTTRPLFIKAGKLLPLNLQTSKSILNSAYTYYAVLQHLQNS